MQPGQMRSDISILVVDDHAMFREGIANYLAAQAGLKVAAGVSNGEHALAFLRDQPVDVVLLDLRLGETDGLTVLRQIKAMPTPPKVLVVSSHEGDAMVVRAWKAGADGYVSKTISTSDLVTAIQRTVAGQNVLSPDLAAKISYSAGQNTLTLREVEIIEQVAAGLSNKEIGSKLSISEKTVKNRLMAIFAKLGASDRTHAVVIAIERGFIGPTQL